ncbi:hypothetical protein [Thermodesulfitimonas autotrophica]|uniref:hypothetical protein n=1 Tax=Thermodesulfitimonas autotrophica TaxID=1894989 RepID=UPI002FE2EE9D
MSGWRALGAHVFDAALFVGHDNITGSNLLPPVAFYSSAGRGRAASLGRMLRADWRRRQEIGGGARK